MDIQFRLNCFIQFAKQANILHRYRLLNDKYISIIDCNDDILQHVDLLFFAFFLHKNSCDHLGHNNTQGQYVKAGHTNIPVTCVSLQLPVLPLAIAEVEINSKVYKYPLQDNVKGGDYQLKLSRIWGMLQDWIYRIKFTSERL